MTTLGERRCRGDLIEAFKAVSQRSNLFNIGIAGLNLVYSNRGSKGSRRVQNLSGSFLTNRVVNLWNMLPLYVKQSDSVDSFKINLQTFKDDNINGARVGNLWDISDEIFSRIEGPSYVANKAKHNVYLKLNPFVAKKKFINLSSTGLYN